MAEKLVGQDIAPPDLYAKITGRAKYAEDFRVDGMVFAKLLLSPMPHCSVLRIDASAALEMEGVIDILTTNDVPAVDAPGEACLTNEPHYEGEPILAVAAVDETTAADAIEAIRVDFEPLPFVLNPLDSLRPDGPNARLDGNTRVGRDLATIKWTEQDFANAPEGTLPMGEPGAEWTVGDVDAGFAEAEVIIDETIVHQSLTHHPMEPRTTMAYWQNGKLYMHTSTQSLARTRASVAGQLDMDMEDVVVVGEFCGGGFGSKISGSTHMLVPAIFSQKINRPVMMRINRYEESYIGRARPGFQAQVKIGFRGDGRITAMDMYILNDGGPYGGSGDNMSAGSTASLAYTPLNQRHRGVGVYTNTPPKAAQRGPGGAQIIGMLEPLMDKAARELGMDRLDLRRVNAPARWAGARFYYEKIEDRKAWDFALMTVASALRMNGGTIEEARLSVNGVAPYPMRLASAEALIRGQTPSDDLGIRAGDLAIEKAQPLRHNDFKVPMMRNLVRRAVRGAEA